MARFCGMLKADLKRAFLTTAFALTVALVVAYCYLATLLEMNTIFAGGGTGRVGYYFDTFILGGGLYLLIFSVSTVPYGTSFCSDLRNHFLHCAISRVPVTTYSLSKAITVALSSFSAVFVGFLIGLFLFSLHVPFNEASAILEITIFGSPGSITFAGYLVVRLFLAALTCSFWAMCALLISTSIPNIFIVYVTPVILYYALGQIVRVGVMGPSYIYVRNLIRGDLLFADLGFSLLVAAVALLLLVSILSLVFYRRVRKRVSGG